MAELAFNHNGDPFEVPAEAVAWRVRRIKGRGAPEVVYGMDELFDVLRTGTAPGSPPAARQAAAAVCRAFLIALEATPGQPLLAFSSPTAPSPTTAAAAPLGASTSSLERDGTMSLVREMDPDDASSVSEEPVAERGEAEDALAQDGAVAAEPLTSSATESVIPSRAEVHLCDAAEVPPYQDAAGVVAPFPFGAPPPPIPPAAPIDVNAVTSMVRAARAMPTEQALDLAISHMRARLRARGEEIPKAPSSGVRFHLVPVPPSPPALGAANGGNGGM